MKQTNETQNNKENELIQSRANRFLDCFQNPGIRKLSTFGGLLAGVVAATFGWMSGLYIGWAVGLIAGAMTALTLSLLLTGLLWREEARYDRIFRSIPQTILAEYDIMLAAREGKLPGRMVLTKDSIILLSLSRGTYRMELGREDVRTIREAEEGRNLLIMLDETKFISVYPMEPEALFRRLSDEGWADSRREV